MWMTIYWAETEKEAIKMVKDVIFAHSEGGFELRNFVSNFTKVLKTISEHLVSQGMSIVVNVKANKQRFLEILRNANKDYLSFSKD